MLHARQRKTIHKSLSDNMAQHRAEVLNRLEEIRHY